MLKPPSEFFQGGIPYARRGRRASSLSIRTTIPIVNSLEPWAMAMMLTFSREWR